MPEHETNTSELSETEAGRLLRQNGIEPGLSFDEERTNVEIARQYGLIALSSVEG